MSLRTAICPTVIYTLDGDNYRSRGSKQPWKTRTPWGMFSTVRCVVQVKLQTVQVPRSGRTEKHTEYKYNSKSSTSLLQSGFTAQLQHSLMLNVSERPHKRVPDLTR